MTTPTSEMYARVAGQLVKADRWFWWSGDMWTAVAPSEDETEWFDHFRVDEDDDEVEEVVPLFRVYAIDEPPEYGVLAWVTSKGYEARCHAAWRAKVAAGRPEGESDS